MAKDTTLSSQIGPFCIVPVWLLDAVHDSTAIHLYTVLSRYANRERRAWPHQDTLAADLGGISVRTIQRAIGVLRDAGAIRTERRRNTHGAVVGIDYILCQIPEPNRIAPGVPSAEPSPPSDYTTPVAGSALRDTGVAHNTTQVSCLCDEPDPLEPDQVHTQRARETRAPKQDTKPDRGRRQTIGDALNDLGRYAAEVEVILEYFRDRWTKAYGVECALMTSPVDHGKCGDALRILGAGPLKQAIDAYLANTDDRMVVNRKHPIGLFLRDASAWLAKAKTVTPRTATEARTATRDANIDGVVGRGFSLLGADDDEGDEPHGTTRPDEPAGTDRPH